METTEVVTQFSQSMFSIFPMIFIILAVGMIVYVVLRMMGKTDKTQDEINEDVNKQEKEIKHDKDAVERIK